MDVTPGDALNRLDDDVSDVADFPMWIPHVLGPLILALLATFIMFDESPVIKRVVVLPPPAVAVITRAARNRLLH